MNFPESAPFHVPIAIGGIAIIALLDNTATVVKKTIAAKGEASGRRRAARPPGRERRAIDRTPAIGCGCWDGGGRTKECVWGNRCHVSRCASFCAMLWRKNRAKIRSARRAARRIGDASRNTRRHASLRTVFGAIFAPFSPQFPTQSRARLESHDMKEAGSARRTYPCRKLRRGSRRGDRRKPRRRAEGGGEGGGK